jgi:ferredoxin
MTKIKQVIVDRNLCIGAASCVAIASKAFKLDEENKAVVQGSWTQEEEKTLIDAAKSCPVDAIVLIDETGKQIWPRKN